MSVIGSSTARKITIAGGWVVIHIVLDKAVFANLAIDG
jgi:hypothetical protein